MNNRLATGFIGGALGALLLIVIMYILQAAGMGAPGFVKMYQGMFGGDDAGAQVIAAILFMISGGIWGLIFTAFVKNPTIPKGMIFGILPCLWIWVVVNPVLGKPLFNDFTVKGLLMPFFFNVVIWGTFVGWYASRRYSAVDRTVG
ncbi:hypothetical protein [Pontibacter chitinilyticus]|uniref:hypothetical protein n=1 Tax=Pontibacter chitinilyticus TaxID=2674989 RepID=UPI0032190898